MAFPIIQKTIQAYPQHAGLLGEFESYYARKYPPP